MDFGETTYPVAAKEHVCEWCGGVISRGERHPHFIGKWEGEWQNWRMHADCYHVADENDALAEGFTPHENRRPLCADKGKEQFK